MKKILFLLFVAAFFLPSCTAIDSAITDLADIGLYHRIYISLEGGEKVDQQSFNVGAEGCTLNVIAYYPQSFTTKKGVVKNVLNDFIDSVSDPDNIIQECTRTKISDMESRYTLVIRPNTTGKILGAGISLLDTTGFDKTESCYGTIRIFQDAE